MNQPFWEKNAESWSTAIQSQLIESRKITGPAMTQEILSHRPRSILDLGCGEGWIASQVLPQGTDYTGLDFSPKLIEIARAAYPEAAFETLGYDDLVRGVWRSSKEFDLAVFNFSLFEEDIRSILRKVSSLIKPTGRILIQTLHPCFTLSPYADGWKNEDFKSFPLPFEGVMPWYGRTLGSWAHSFSQSGLKISKISEPLNPMTQVPLSLIFTLATETP